MSQYDRSFNDSQTYMDFLDTSSEEEQIIDSDNDDEDEIFRIRKGQNMIYQGSDIKLSEFVVVLFELCMRIHLSRVGIGLLLGFLRAILPSSNNIIPISYYKLITMFKLQHLNEIHRKYACLRCNKILNSAKDTCSEQICQNFKKQKVNVPKSDPYFVTTNYIAHFKSIIQKCWPNILKYRSALQQENKITDIGNAIAYRQSKEICKNSICIILFADEADFSKSSTQNKLYFILGQVMDLPYHLRNSYANIITFLTWGGYIYNFNKVVTFIQPSFSQFLQNELHIPSLNMSLKIHLFVTIGDAPCSAKMYNIHQFNGAYGCFQCLHPGEISSSKSRIYKYEVFNHAPRTPALYLTQVAEAQRTNSIIMGIKGECFFSKYSRLPLSGLIDYMHCCLEGTFKRTVEIFFDSTNSRHPYYLGTL
jgi:hypothetical protein